MSSRGRHDPDRGSPTETKGSRGRTRDLLEDVVLDIRGKRLKANSTLLAHNSPQFAEMINEARRGRDGETEILYDATADRKDGRRRGGSTDVLRIEVPNQHYSDMKIIVKAIQNHAFKPERLTGDQAVQIMPAVDQFGMKQLRKACSTAMVETLKTLREKQETVPIPELFKYLSVADKYKLYEVKDMCLDVCSRSYTASHRALVVKEKHISDKCKTELLNRMCDRMQADYEVNLREIRQESDRRFAEIEKKKVQFMEDIGAWKVDLQNGVDAYIAETKAAHAKLEDKFKRKEIVDRLTQLINTTCTNLQRDQEHLRSDMHDILKSLEEKAIEDDEIPPEDIWEKFTSTHEMAVLYIDAIQTKFRADVSAALVYCGIENVRKNITQSFAIQENLDSVSADLASTIKCLSETEANFQQEKSDHERTKVELLKLQKRDHKLNTWIKWAKPEIADDEQCLCFRHTRPRQGCTT